MVKDHKELGLTANAFKRITKEGEESFFKNYIVRKGDDGKLWFIKVLPNDPSGM